MVILGIETTCDETGVGVVENGKKILSNVVSSSAILHKKYGGIVPEVAAREQLKLIVPVIDEALLSARCKLADVDAIAVAYGPGLIGSLLIGVETAKTLSLSLDKPLIRVNHLVGHVYANWISQKLKVKNQNWVPPKFPLVSLIVSGGHTDLILMADHRKYRWLGGTRDDAAGEVFDKVARVLGLRYPGGPEIEKLAASYQLQKTSLKFPRPMIDEGNFDFSFAGLKTAVVNLVTRDPLRRRSEASQLPETRYSEIAYEFQNAVVDVLVTKTIKAAKKFGVKSIVIGGGVAANAVLRSRLFGAGKKFEVTVLFPEKSLSIDNGVMIAAAAFFEKNIVDPLKLQSNPSLHF